jgi:hypothetical protein
MHGVEASSTADRISALAQLLRAAVGLAENLTVVDEEARLELLDSLACGRTDQYAASCGGALTLHRSWSFGLQSREKIGPVRDRLGIPHVVGGALTSPLSSSRIGRGAVKAWFADEQQPRLSRVR